MRSYLAPFSVAVVIIAGAFCLWAQAPLPVTRLGLPTQAAWPLPAPLEATEGLPPAEPLGLALAAEAPDAAGSAEASRTSPSFLTTAERLGRATERFPGSMARHWRVTLPVVLTTGALITLVDRPAAGRVQSFALEHNSGNLSNGGLYLVEPIAVGITAFGLAHCWRCPPALATLETTLVAVAFSEAAGGAMKLAARRERPYLPGSHGEFWEGGSSFPSGHALAAFAMASVLAHRYPEHHWVPWVAYSLAGGISLLRFTAKRHYPADLFFGGTMGYLIGRCAVSCP